MVGADITALCRQVTLHARREFWQGNSAKIGKFRIARYYSLRALTERERRR